MKFLNDLKKFITKNKKKLIKEYSDPKHFENDFERKREDNLNEVLNSLKIKRQKSDRNPK